MKCSLILICTLLLTAPAFGASGKAGDVKKILPERRTVDQFCEQIAKDGHAESFHSLLLVARDGQKGCKACGTFFRIFVSACKPKRPGKRTKGEPPPVIIPQVDPSAPLLDLVSRIFHTLAEAPTLREERVMIVRMLVELLDRRHAKPIERHYFRAISSYVKAPFSALISSNVTKDETHHGSSFPTQKENVDSMFE